MKIFKLVFIMLVIGTICLFVLFGPAIVNKVAATPEVNKLNDLKKYDGYIVQSLDADWFGNWVIVRKGREKSVFKCSDSIFADLKIKDRIGQ